MKVCKYLCTPTFRKFVKLKMQCLSTGLSVLFNQYEKVKVRESNMHYDHKNNCLLQFIYLLNYILLCSRAPECVALKRFMNWPFLLPEDLDRVTIQVNLTQEMENHPWNCNFMVKTWTHLVIFEKSKLLYFGFILFHIERVLLFQAHNLLFLNLSKLFM